MITPAPTRKTVISETTTEWSRRDEAWDDRPNETYRLFINADEDGLWLSHHKVTSKSETARRLEGEIGGLFVAFDELDWLIATLREARAHCWLVREKQTTERAPETEQP